MIRDMRIRTAIVVTKDSNHELDGTGNINILLLPNRQLVTRAPYAKQIAWLSHFHLKYRDQGEIEAEVRYSGGAEHEGGSTAAH